MKKLSFIILFVCLLAGNLSGQTVKQQLNAMFSRGEYSDAAGLCYGTATMVAADERAYYYNFAKKCNECLKLRTKGQDAWKQNDYQKAFNAYQKLAELNPQDAQVVEFLPLCRKKLDDMAALAAADAKAYTEATDILSCKSYLTKWPNGQYVVEVSDRLARLYADERQFNIAMDYAKTETTRKYIADIRSSYAMASTTKESAGTGTHTKSSVKTQTQTQTQNQAQIRMRAQKAVDAAAEEKDFENATDIKSCREYLSKWPNGKYSNEVSDKLAIILADEGYPYSAEAYAKSDSVKEYVAEKKKSTYSAHNGRSAYNSKSANTNGMKYKQKNSIPLGVNVAFDADFAKRQYTLVPRVEFAVGSYQNFLNFAVGFQYRKISGSNSSPDSFDVNLDPDFYGENHPYLVADQIGIPLYFRFNFGKRKNDTKFPLTIGASANYNISAKYDRKDSFDVSSAGQLVNKFNFSVFGRFGVSYCGWELSLILRYDLTPVFNVGEINKEVMVVGEVAPRGETPFNFYENYGDIRTQAHNNFFYGVSLTIPFVMSKK